MNRIKNQLPEWLIANEKNLTCIISIRFLASSTSAEFFAVTASSLQRKRSSKDFLLSLTLYPKHSWLTSLCWVLSCSNHFERFLFPLQPQQDRRSPDLAMWKTISLLTKKSGLLRFQLFLATFWNFSTFLCHFVHDCQSRDINLLMQNIIQRILSPCT